MAPMTVSSEPAGLNGVDPAAVDAVVLRFRARPADADVGFGATVDWEGGYRTRASAGSFGPLAGDEPTDLAGTGTGPAPEELLLAAVGQCLVVGIVGAASARGLPIEHLSVTARGRVDLAVAYGLADGHAGFSGIDVQVDLRADLPRADLDALVQQALARAPIPNTVANPVPVQARLA
jgi:uncharacterized OsmC-like protein